MHQSYSLLSFSPENLASAFETEYFSKEFIIKNKFHYKFFLEYLGSKTEDALHARTILIENEYLSRDFLHDFSSFYALCFNDSYQKKCKRVHFFKSEINEEEFENDILHNTHKVINDTNYLGFIVIKHLPNVLFGTTILQTYSNETKIRRYLTRQYFVHIFGKELKINSIAFQEQDSAVSACATSALWSAFQKTSCIFQTPLPTPIDITNSAKNLFFETGRLLPSSGLDHYQIGNAIKDVGLVFELRNNENYIANITRVKGFIYSYIKSGLPILLGLEIDKIGRHLITLLGYQESKINFKRTKSISLYSEQIKMFYAHDDQVGPFSRLQFIDSIVKNNLLETSWWKDKLGKRKLYAEIVSIIVPLSDKIRITFDDVYKIIGYFDNYLYRILLNKECVWDIYLSRSDIYKDEISSNKFNIKQDLQAKILFRNLPKYIWIARALVDDLLLLEFIFDSTEIANGFYCLSFNCFNSDIRDRLLFDLEDKNFIEFVNEYLNPSYLGLFLKELS